MHTRNGYLALDEHEAIAAAGQTAEEACEKYLNTSLGNYITFLRQVHPNATNEQISVLINDIIRKKILDILHPMYDPSSRQKRSAGDSGFDGSGGAAGSPGKLRRVSEGPY
jgi:hypothetical protein